MDNGFKPGTPATEEIKNRLFKEACPKCEHREEMYQCAVIQALRRGTLTPTETAGRPCARTLFCEGCENITASEETCLAEAAAQLLTNGENPGMFQRATCAVALRRAPSSCPLGLNGLI